MRPLVDWRQLFDERRIHYIERGPNVKRGEINIQFECADRGHLKSSHSLPAAQLYECTWRSVMLSRRPTRRAIWKPIFGFEGLYEVCDEGFVRSLDVLRQHGGYRPRVIPGRVLKTRGSTYPSVSLWSHDAAHAVDVRVHVLVATAFCLNFNNSPMVLHKDDCKTNNRSSNLYWGTCVENFADASRNGKLAKRLTAQQVVALRVQHEQHKNDPTAKRYDGFNKALAERFNISFVMMQNIINRKVWRHV